MSEAGKSERGHHRPVRPGGDFFEAQEGGADPAVLAEAAEVAATLMVRGVRGSHDAELVDRVLHLADTEGLDALAVVWSASPADSLAGCLWRLYLLRSWVYADPTTVAAEYDAGRRAQVARVVAGVAEPPGPDELRAMVDEVLRGIASSDFADVLLRAAAFARVVATGRAELGVAPAAQAARMLLLSEQLEAAGHTELRAGLA